MQSQAQPRRLLYGWVVVAAAALGLLFGAFPIAVSSFGMFFPPFVRDFHAGHGAVSLAFTIQNTASAALAPAVGGLADRFGARSVILTGLGLLGLVLLSAQAIGSSLWQLYVFYLLLGVIAPTTTAVPYGLVVSRWFNRRRGFALGLMMTGLGSGAILMPPVAQSLIAAYGWRTAFAIVGCAVLILPMPVVGLFLKESPSRVGLFPDGAAAAPKGTLDSEGFTWREIRRTRTFWLMLAAFVLLSAAVHACIIPAPQLMAERGAGPRTAALATSAIGVALLAGRLGTGYLLDRFFAPRVAAFVVLLAASGIAILWSGAPGAAAIAGVFLAGLAFAAEVDIIPYLMSRYFGLRSLGAAFGFGFGAFVLAGGLGPLVMGFAHDRSGSYRGPLAAFFAAALLAAALIVRLGPYRFAAKENG